MKEELYRKVGRRYVRANDPWAYDGLQEGHWHVWVRSGLVTIREFVLPHRREVSATIEEVREGMIAAMNKVNKSRPTSRSLTGKEAKAIAAYRKVMGEEVDLAFDGISMGDLVDAGIKVLQDEF